MDQTTEPNGSDGELKGRVRAVRTEETTTASRGGEQVQQTRRVSAVTYNAGGGKVEEVHYRDDGTAYLRTAFAYDDAGRPARQSSYDAAGVEVSTGSFIDGRPVEIIDRESDGSPRGMSSFLYDAKGRPVYAARFGPDGALSRRREIRYDREGGRLEETLLPRLAGDGDFGFYVENFKGLKVYVSAEGARLFRVKYDSGGNPLRSAFYDRRGRLIKKYVFSHDARGDLVKVAEYAGPAYLEEDPSASGPLPLIRLFLFIKPVYTHAARGEFLKAVKAVLQEVPLAERFFSYDPAGRIVREQELVAGTLVLETTFTYDTDGRLVEETQYGAAASLRRRQTLTRKFDSYGNWIERTSSEVLAGGGETTQVFTLTRRVIDYQELNLPEA